MNVGERIRARRKAIGLSAEQIAERMGVSPATIYRYESSEIMSMRIDKLEPIAEALNTTPAYLMGWTDDPINYEDPELLASSSGPQFDYLLEGNNGDLVAAVKGKLALDEATEKDVYADTEHKDYEIKTIATHHEGDEWTEEEILTLAAHKLGHTGELSETDLDRIKLAVKIALAKDDK